MLCGKLMVCHCVSSLKYLYRGITIQLHDNYLCRVAKEESLYRGYCPGGDTREAAEVYCNCMEGEVAACQEGLDFMACEEIEKRKGKSKYKKGNIQASVSTK